MFKTVQKVVYSVRNKPVCEFKNWCETTPLQGYVIYPTHPPSWFNPIQNGRGLLIPRPPPLSPSRQSWSVLVSNSVLSSSDSRELVRCLETRLRLYIEVMMN